MLNRLLYRLTSNKPTRLINLDSGPYLERYYIGRLCGITFYLHRFVSSDSERHCHNHPWKYGGSVILSGSYLEERMTDLCPHFNDGYLFKMHRRRWFNVVNGNTFHRIHRAEPGTWSLFFHGPRQESYFGALKGWGFLSVNYSGSGRTEFVSYPAKPSLNWWRTAPRGVNSGRVKL